MTEPRLRHVHCLGSGGLHRLAYWEWGHAQNPRVVVCVHGLSRQGRDFDALAQDLCGEFRVVCPDMPGRGQSDWLTDPMAYAMPTYVACMVTLLARLDAAQLDWVGTSMGGLIGLSLIGLAGASVRRLVLNDVGPSLEPVSIARIGSYLGLPTRWPTVAAAAQDLLAISKGFGPHTAAQWLALTQHQVKPDGDAFKPHYDPAIAVPFKAMTADMAAAGQAALWAAYGRITCPTLLLRGAESDLLSPATAARMTQSGPRAQLHEFAGVGHAPMLVQPDQRAVVKRFLLAP
jgi:pimeloyl-ACP methyl ester carboxylesterase